MGKNTDLIYRAMSEGVRTASEFAQYKKGYRMNSNSMISKELLSEVLGIVVDSWGYNKGRKSIWYVESFGSAYYISIKNLNKLLDSGGI